MAKMTLVHLLPCQICQELLQPHAVTWIIHRSYFQQMLSDNLHQVMYDCSFNENILKGDNATVPQNR